MPHFMAKPTIYVLAGANGIGKTTVNPDFIPKEVPFINADDIAKQLRERLGEINVQELANSEAIDRMNELMAKRADFAIETNLADDETWQFLIGIQKVGYAVMLGFYATDQVSICIERVKNRHLQGGHFVRPDIVVFRYETGLKLLRIYRAIPDKLFLIDNSGNTGIVFVEINHGLVVSQRSNQPTWVQLILQKENILEQNAENLEEIKERYRKSKN